MRQLRILVSIWLGLGVGLFFSQHAWAVADTFNGILYRPATGRTDYVMLHDTRTLYQYQFSFGVTQVYSWQPLSLRTPAGNRLQGVIDSALASHANLAFGVMDRFQIGASVPYYEINKFQDPNVVPGLGTSNKMSLGDAKVELKLRVLDVPKTRFGLAIIPFATIPTGKSSYFIADEKWNAGATLAFDAHFTPKIASTLNLGYQYGEHVVLRNIDYQHRFLMGVGLKGYVGKQLVLFAEADSSGALNDIFTSSDQNQLDFSAGAAFDVKKTGVQLKLAGGSCAICGVGASKVTAAFGINYRYNSERYAQKDDEYRMSIFNLLDKTLSPESYYALRDKCPADADQFDPKVDDPACPKYYELNDVAELYFRCPKPEEYEEGKDNPDCEKVFSLNEDYSSSEVENIVNLAVSQLNQNCPEDAAGYNPQFHDPACPKFYELRESMSPEEWAQFSLKANPEGKKPAVVAGEIQTIDPVYFDFNSSKLPANALSALDQVVTVINQSRWIQQVRIGGHADSIGTKEANYKISQLRAAAVISYMREHGVRTDVDFVAIPYGALRPALPNDTEENRAKNRRVVFTVVKPIDEVYPKRAPQTDAAPKSE